MILSNWLSDESVFKIRIAETVIYTCFYFYRIISHPHYFYYLYTNFNWTINFIYFYVATTITYKTLKLEKEIGQKVLQVFLAIIVPTSLFVSILYWSFMSDEVASPTRVLELRIRMALSHLVNLLPLVDLLVSNVTLPYLFVIFPMLFFIVYAVMVVLVHFLTPLPWPYAVLDRINGGEYGFHPRMVAVLFISFLCLGVTFLMTKGIIYLRDRKKPKVYPEPIVA